MKKLARFITASTVTESIMQYRICLTSNDAQVSKKIVATD